ncbi:MAG: homoserine O-succinyltransferase, partial [Xanthomonas perforans]|nr:homoserine O-succinyltransferase [Xanthomonas perforans]
PATTDDGLIAVRGELVIALPMRHAGMRELRLRYELIGAANAPVVFVAGGISAHRHLAASDLFPEKGWVDGLVGAGRALDPASRRL